MESMFSLFLFIFKKVLDFGFGLIYVGISESDLKLDVNEDHFLIKNNAKHFKISSYIT